MCKCVNVQMQDDIEQCPLAIKISFAHLHIDQSAHQLVVVPYKEDSTGKKQQVAKMFDNISGRYDFLNHFLSLGIDILWRRKAIGLLRDLKPKTILDVATGTGDFSIEALSLKPENVIGVDISEGMLEVGRGKLKARGLDKTIELKLGDSENLPFADNYFDAVIVA